MMLAIGPSAGPATTGGACRQAAVKRRGGWQPGSPWRPLHPRAPRGAAVRKALLRTAAVWLQATALVVLLGGCASWKRVLPEWPDVRGERARRADDAVRQFEVRRERAEIEAAMTALRSGDAEGARARLEQLLGRNPQHAEARRLLAELHLLDGNAEAAEHALKPLLPMAGKDAATSHTLGLVRDAQGRVVESRAALRRAVELEPDHPVYQASYQAIVVGDETRQQRSVPPQVLDHGGNAGVAPLTFAATPGSTALCTSVALPAAPPKGSALQGSVSEHLRGNLPHAARQWLDRAEHHFLAARPHEAAAALRQAALHDPSNRHIALAAAVMAIRHNQPRLAVERIEALPPHLAQSVPLQLALGTAWYRLGDDARAEAAFRRAIDLDNTHPLSYFLLGCTLKRRGAAKDAEAAWAQAARLDVHFAMPQSLHSLPNCELAARDSDRSLDPGSSPGSRAPLPAAWPLPAAETRTARRP